ncbi:MAG: cytidylate kinase-like family protein [Balneolaceae bacterium]|nr:MAG: cytidylate kinase-like family protein [Balneolaceae bacterium]
MPRKAEHIIEEQIANWKHENSVASRRSPKNKTYPVITISREFGALGAAVAAQIEKKIGFKVWDKDLLIAITNELGGGVRAVELIDEKKQQTMEETITGFLRNIPTSTTYLRSLIKVVNTIEEYGNSVIVGRGANYVCKHPGVLNVRVVCPLKERIHRYADKEKISQKQASVIIDNKERERNEFVKLNFHKDPTTPSDYDLVLNSNVFSPDVMADIVINAYNKKNGTSFG